MDKFHGISELNIFFTKDNCDIFFSIIANEEKNEGGEKTAKAKNMYTNLFQFPPHINT